jgi:hypothetical protein
LQQPPEERHNLIEQQLVLETIIKGEGKFEIDVKALKESVIQAAPQIKDVKDEPGFDRIEAELFKKHSSPVKAVEEPGKKPPAEQPAAPAGPAPKPEETKKEEPANAPR